MICNDIKKQLLIASEQGNDLTPELKEHLQTCDACRDFQETLGDIMAMPLSAQPSRQLDRTILQAAKDVPRQKQPQPSTLAFPRWRWLGAAASLVAAITLSALLLQHENTGQPNNHPPPATETLDIVSFDDYMQALDDAMETDLLILEASLNNS